MKKNLSALRRHLAGKQAQRASALPPDETPVQLFHAHDQMRCFLRIEPIGTHVIGMTEQQYEACIMEMQKVLVSFRARNVAATSSH